MLTKDKIIDIHEKSIDADVLTILPNDRTTASNILWCADDYASMGVGYEFHDTIEIGRNSDKNDGTITHVKVLEREWICGNGERNACPGR